MTVLGAGKVPVIDANVAVKWFLPEAHSPEARLLVKERRFVGYERLHIPELFFAECGSLLWKRQRQGEIPKEETKTIMAALLALPFEIHPHSALIQAALEIAANTDRSIYDSLYVALAVQQQTKLLTADLKLYRALQNGPLASYLLWIEDIMEIL